MASHAIIGCGRVAVYHAAAAAVLDVPIKYLLDVNQAAAQKLQKKWCNESIVTSDIQTVMGDKDVTSVSICLPHYLHYEVVRECLLNDLDVIVEKPFGFNSKTISDLKDLAMERGRKLTVCYQHMADPTVLEGIRAAKDGSIGRLLFANAHCYCNRSEAYYSTWRGSLRKEGGSVLINQSIHTLRMLVELSTSVKCVAARASTVELVDIIDTEETLIALLETDEGLNITLCCSNTAHQDWDSGIHIIGTKGDLKIAIGSHNVLSIGNNVKVSTAPDYVDVTKFPKSYYGWNHIRLFRKFFSPIEGVDPQISDKDSADSEVMRVVEDIYAHVR